MDNRVSLKDYETNIKDDDIKVEIKIKPIKNNCWNCRKSIVFKIKFKSII